MEKVKHNERVEVTCGYCREQFRINVLSGYSEMRAFVRCPRCFTVAEVRHVQPMKAAA